MSENCVELSAHLLGTSRRTGCRARPRFQESAKATSAPLRERTILSSRITARDREKSRTENEPCEVLRSGSRPRYWSYCKASRDIGTPFWSKWLGSSWLRARGPCPGRRRGVVHPSHEQRGRRTAADRVSGAPAGNTASLARQGRRRILYEVRGLWEIHPRRQGVQELWPRPHR